MADKAAHTIEGNYISGLGVLHFESLSEPHTKEVTDKWNDWGVFSGYEYHEVDVKLHEGTFKALDIINDVRESLNYFPYVSPSTYGECQGEYRFKKPDGTVIQGKFCKYSFDNYLPVGHPALVLNSGNSSLTLWDDSESGNIYSIGIDPTWSLEGYIRVNDVFVVSKSSSVYVAGSIAEGECGNIYAPVIEELWSNEKIPLRLTISGNWSNTQYSGGDVGRDGFTFSCSFSDGTTKTVDPTSIYPRKWDSMPGVQRAYFYYTLNGFTVSVAKEANTINELSSISIDTLPRKTVYNHHERFNPDGSVVTAHWVYPESAGTSSNITSLVEWSPMTLNNVGNQVITASYTYDGDTYNDSFNATVNKLLNSIEITKGPDKTVYYYGDSFNPAGSTVIATYSDGTIENVTSRVSWNPVTLDSHGSVEVTASYSYNGDTKTDTIGVTVNKVLNSISISQNPIKTKYYYGDTFNPAGSIVTATYSDGSPENVTNKVTWSPTTLYTIGSQVITARYTYEGREKTSTLSVTVKKHLTSIEITRNPNKMTYRHHDTFNPAGSIVVAYYSDGTTDTFDDEHPSPNLTWSPTELNTVGSQAITASYTYPTYDEDKDVSTASITVEVTKTLLSISITENPDKMKYYYGDTFDPSGSTVIATYSYGNPENVTSSTKWSPAVFNTAHGSIPVTASYTYNNDTCTAGINVKVNKILTGISIVSVPTKTNYYYGDTFDSSGSYISASYSDGSPENVTNKVTWSPMTLNKGHGQVLVSATYRYEGKEDSKGVYVTVNRIPVQLIISGSMTNTQLMDSNVDITGLSFSVKYSDNSQISGITPSSYSPTKWSIVPDVQLSAQTCTFYYTDTESGKTVSASYTNNEVSRMLTGLNVGGGWSKTQYTGQAIDYTGLTFTASYNNNTTATVTPSSYSPTTWGSTVGTQTCIFYYAENGIEEDASSSVSVADYWLTVPLTLQAREAGNVSITKTGDPGTIYYSKNGGSQTALDSGVSIPVSAGDRVSFYRTLTNDLNYDRYFRINCTNNCYVYGNVMSLYNKDNFAELRNISYKYSFYELFQMNYYIDINESIGNLILPATTLSEYCYSSMFYSCRSLTKAPELPATTLATSCYSNMFGSCEGLVVPPSILPATTLADYCYDSMFSYCTSLSDVSYNMLPATTLAYKCYDGMFSLCRSLTTSPKLPAVSLVQQCYAFMFRKCASLNSITCLATDISATLCTDGWVNGVSSSGTFYKNSAMSSWSTGTSGIPSGWTVRDA